MAAVLNRLYTWKTKNKPMFLGGRFGVLYRTQVLCMGVTKKTNTVHPSMIYRTKEDWSNRGEGFLQGHQITYWGQPVVHDSGWKIFSIIAWTFPIYMYRYRETLENSYRPLIISFTFCFWKMIIAESIYEPLTISTSKQTLDIGNYIWLVIKIVLRLHNVKIKKYGNQWALEILRDFVVPL